MAAVFLPKVQALGRLLDGVAGVSLRRSARQSLNSTLDQVVDSNKGANIWALE